MAPAILQSSNEQVELNIDAVTIPQDYTPAALAHCKPFISGAHAFNEQQTTQQVQIE
jgi:hypothetical protein